MALTTTFKLQIVAALTSALDLSVTAAATVDYAINTTLADGTGSSQADQVWHDQSTLAASTAEDIDLSLPLTNALGQSISFTNIKALLVRASSGNGSTINIGPKASEGFADFFGDASDRVVLTADGVFFVTSPVAGVAVVDNTDDKLTITNDDGAASATYDIIVVGVATVS